jgi:hypothetical protein
LGWVHQPGFLHFSIDSVVKKEQTTNQYLLYFKQKLHHAHSFVDNNRVDVEFVSAQKERYTLRHISFSGETDCVEVTLPFAPDFWVIDPDEHLGDAVIKYPQIVSNTALKNYPNAYFRFKPETMTDNSEMRVEYHLTTPERGNIPYPVPGGSGIFNLSDNHYWHIVLYDTNITSGCFQFFYLAAINQKDYNLFQGYSKDDLLLLHRRNAMEDWQIHPATITGNNTSGQLTTTSLLAGEYTLAMGSNVSTRDCCANLGISIFPNPTSNYIICQTAGGDWENYSIEIFDYTGKKIYSLPTATTWQKVDFSSFAEGVYFVKLRNGKNQEYTGKVAFLK